MIDARFLIVGAEGGASRGWIEHLREAGASISVVADGSDALRHLEIIQPEVVLLDLRLRGELDGFDTCRAIRARSAAIVITVAETVGTYDEVVVLALGADHFLHVETPVEIVIARLRSLIRRSRGTVLVGAPAAIGHTVSNQTANGQAVEHRTGAAPAQRSDGMALRSGRGPVAAGVRAASGGERRVGAERSVPGASQLALLNGSGPDGPTERIVDGDLEVDLVAREVRVAGTEVPLTRIEFDLLVTLARNPRRVFTREQLMASAWDHPFDGSHVLDAHLSRMRVKITDAGGERVAHAVRGVGYRLRS